MNDHQEASAVGAHASAALEDIFSALDPDLREAVGRMIGEDAPALAEQFYSVLLHDEEAKGYLSHDVVNRRLRASLQRWITQLFNFEDVDFAGVISKQIEVGAVHARIKLAPHMMAMGMRVLTGGMRRVVDRMPLPPDQALRVHLYVTDLMHLADGLIMSAFVRELQKAVRNDKHYRMTGLRQDISLERERQRAARPIGSTGCCSRYTPDPAWAASSTWRNPSSAPGSSTSHNCCSTSTTILSRCSTPWTKSIA
ncbi:MAG: hypothetical protein IPK20_13720 [Betaproteobacteria bacterium]|nr:hypothetical protein [Betaproteobacteria bacterium]